MNLAFQQRGVLPPVWSASCHGGSRVWPGHWDHLWNSRGNSLPTEPLPGAFAAVKMGFKGSKTSLLLVCQFYPICTHEYRFFFFLLASQVHPCCTRHIIHMLWKCGCQGKLLQLNCISIFYKIRNAHICRYLLIIIIYRIIHMYLH